jgi:multimeric flavodoxin WrbA
MKCFETHSGQCANQTDDLNDYVEMMREADGIIFASPTYFADVTPEIKALIDRTGMLSRSGGDFLKYKVGAAVISVRRGGAIHAFDTINHLFLACQMIVPGSSYWNMGLGRVPGDVHADEEGMQCMETLGENMVWLLKRLYE